ncbi:MAG: site-2 protease family protein [Chloroflexi bacterium]|nr:site-2 protease family protein [Chloroflexota bacterium]
MNLEILAIVPILSLLMLVHELGHFITARRAGITVQEFGFGLPPRIFGIRHNGIVYSLNWVPFGAFVKMLGEEDPGQPGSFASKGVLTRGIVLAAGAGMNFLLAVVVFAAGHLVGWPTLREDLPVEIAEVVANSPAQAAGLQAGDVVYTFNGQEVRGATAFRALTERNLGQTVALGIKRGQQDVQVALAPRARPPEGEGYMGVRLASPVQPTQYPIHEALWQGLLLTLRVIGLTLAAPVMLLQGLLTPDAVRPIGLPGMAQVASQAVDFTADTGWWYPIFWVVGAFSAGLSLANMLPLPALDGGRLLFVVIEALRGRRVSPEREAAIHFVGLVVLLTLMLLISVNDLLSPLPAVNFDFR